MAEGAARDPRSGDAVLITGATGFVGREILTRYLERTDRCIYALVRADDAEGADQRLRDGIREATGTDVADSERLVAVPGDVQQPGLGLADPDREELAADVSDVIHSAASVSFTLSLDESRSINVEGTRNVVDFAARCADRGDGLHRLCYVSTAYVAGTHEGEFGEDDLAVGQEFRNSYEQSKYEAERLVRKRARRLPVQIVRPSIVVGERDSGWTGSFNVLYAPLKMFRKAGGVSLLPAEPDAPVDVVPVDYVADGIFELSTSADPVDNRTYHLVAGRDASTIERLVRLAARRLRRREPRLIPPRSYRELVHPVLVRAVSGRRKKMLKKLETFFPYMSARVRYSDARTRRRLEPAGIEPVSVDSYFDRLITFAERAGWGSATVTREEARQGQTGGGSTAGAPADRRRTAAPV
jgi:long-chain acyl-CoA synthetase